MKLSPKQKKLAAAAKPRKKITKADFEALKKKKKKAPAKKTARKLPKRGMRAGRGKK
mgnify:FL=1|tara:strand:+ start:329 stop:499 length:171 start_codon:yes stop_codon:yes gene_type:complete